MWGGRLWLPKIFSWPTPYDRPSTGNLMLCHKAQKFLSLLWSGITVQNAKCMRCLILIARTVKVPILWYLTLCNLVQTCRRFGISCLLHKKRVDEGDGKPFRNIWCIQTKLHTVTRDKTIRLCHSELHNVTKFCTILITVSGVLASSNRNYRQNICSVSTHQHMTRHYVASHWQICWTGVATDGVMYSNLLGQTVTFCRGERFDLLPHHPMGAVQPDIIHMTPNSKKRNKKYKWISRVLDSSIKTSQWWQIIHLWQIANTRVKSQGV